MTAPAENYLTDTPYTWGFYGDLGPGTLRYTDSRVTRLKADGEEVVGAEAQRGLLQERFDQLQRHRMDRVVALGIADPC